MFGAVADNFEMEVELVAGPDGEVDTFPGDLTASNDEIRSGRLVGTRRRGGLMVRFGGGKLSDFDWWGDDSSIAVVIALDLLLGIGRDCDKLIGGLGGFIVGAAERLEKKLQSKAHERVEDAEARVFEILVVHLPVILGRNVAIT